MFDSDTAIEASEMQAILGNGSLTLNNGAKLTINGDVDFNKSTFAINGSGTIAAASGFKLTISSSTYVCGSITFEGEVEISGSGMLVIDSGATLTNNGYIELTNAGTITNNGTITNAVNSTMLIRTGCTVTNYGTITNYGWITTESEGAITGNAVKGNNQPVVSPPSGG